jgi:hypothetical protein
VEETMLEKLKRLLAERSLAIYGVAFLAVALLIFHLATRPKPIPGIPIEVIQREAEAKAEAKLAQRHEREVAKYEAASIVSQKREAQLSGNIQNLKRELDVIRQDPGHVGGGEPGNGGSAGHATVDGAVVAKLEQIVAEQGSLIEVVTKDRDDLKIALIESKLATESYKTMANKRLQDVEILTATVNRATAQAKREITKAEWRGGAKGFVLGALVRSLVK